MSRKTTVVALALLLALALAGCGSDRDALTIYSGRTQNLIGPLLERFNKETGIAIDVKYGDSAELALLHRRGGRPDPGRRVPLPEPRGDRLPRRQGPPRPARRRPCSTRSTPRFRNDDGRWVGISGRLRVLVYNTEQVTEAELPDSVLDLTDDRVRRQGRRRPRQRLVPGLRDRHAAARVGEDARPRPG